MRIKGILILTIRMKQMKLLGHIMRKGGLKNLIITGCIEGVREKRKREKLN